MLLLMGALMPAGRPVLIHPVSTPKKSVEDLTVRADDSKQIGEGFRTSRQRLPNASRFVYELTLMSLSMDPKGLAPSIPPRRSIHIHACCLAVILCIINSWHLIARSIPCSRASASNSPCSQSGMASSHWKCSDLVSAPSRRTIATWMSWSPFGKSPACLPLLLSRIICQINWESKSI